MLALDDKQLPNKFVNLKVCEQLLVVKQNRVELQWRTYKEQETICIRQLANVPIASCCGPKAKRCIESVKFSKFCV